MGAQGNNCWCDDEGQIIVQEGCKKCMECGWSACTV